VMQGPDIDVNDIALTSDGKIVAAGAITVGNTSAVLEVMTVPSVRTS